MGLLLKEEFLSRACGVGPQHVATHKRTHHVRGYPSWEWGLQVRAIPGLTLVLLECWALVQGGHLSTSWLSLLP